MYNNDIKGGISFRILSWRNGFSCFIQNIMSLTQRQQEGGAVSFCWRKITQAANTTASSFTFEQMWFIWSRSKGGTQRTLCAECDRKHISDKAKKNKSSALG